MKIHIKKKKKKKRSEWCMGMFIIGCLHKMLNEIFFVVGPQSIIIYGYCYGLWGLARNKKEIFLFEREREREQLRPRS